LERASGCRARFGVQHEGDPQHGSAVSDSRNLRRVDAVLRGCVLAVAERWEAAPCEARKPFQPSRQCEELRTLIELMKIQKQGRSMSRRILRVSSWKSQCILGLVCLAAAFSISCGKKVTAAPERPPTLVTVSAAVSRD